MVHLAWQQKEIIITVPVSIPLLDQVQFQQEDNRTSQNILAMLMLMYEIQKESIKLFVRPTSWSYHGVIFSSGDSVSEGVQLLSGHFLCGATHLSYLCCAIQSSFLLTVFLMAALCSCAHMIRKPMCQCFYPNLVLLNLHLPVQTYHQHILPSLLGTFLVELIGENSFHVLLSSFNLFLRGSVAGALCHWLTMTCRSAISIIPSSAIINTSALVSNAKHST